MKRFIVILLAITAIFSICGCEPATESPTSPDTTTGDASDTGITTATDNHTPSTAIVEDVEPIIEDNIVESAPELEWVHVPEGDTRYFSGSSVRQTSDGGYIVTGSKFADDPDVILVKFDTDGNETWNRIFGGNGIEKGSSVRQTADGGYIIAGEIGEPYNPPPTTLLTTDPDSQETETETDDADIWLIKTDSEGRETWNRTFGGDDHEEARAVCQTSDGGYIIVGHIYMQSVPLPPIELPGDNETVPGPQEWSEGGADIWLIKTDANGNEVWNWRFGGSEYDFGTSVEQTSDGGYIVGGYTSSFGAGNRDVWLIKTDANGNETWSQTYGGSAGDTGESVIQTSDGGYIIIGKTLSYGAGEEDVWLIKTDSNGNEIWNRTFGGSDTDIGESVYQTSDGGYIIAAYTRSFGGKSSDVWLIKVDDQGNETWSLTYDGGSGDIGTDAVQTTDGGYIVTGKSGSRFMLIKYKH